MILTDDEKRMRDGAEGAAVAAAMDLLTRYGDALACERLCDVRNVAGSMTQPSPVKERLVREGGWDKAFAVINLGCDDDIEVPAMRVPVCPLQHGFGSDAAGIVPYPAPNIELQAGLVRRRAGDVRIFGARAPSGDVRWAARHGLTLVPERRQLYPGLSASDSIVLGCYSWTSSLSKARRSTPFGMALELFPGIGPQLGQPAGTLSGGQQQMVAIMRGLASDPKILAVDEPCRGLAEAVSRRVYAALARIHEAGTTLIVVEEAPKRALAICARRVEVRTCTSSST